MSRFTKSLLILSVCLLSGAITASASTFYVQPGGVSPNFANLTDALNTVGAYAGTDHIIVVMAGTYATDDNLTVPANIAEIYGEDKATVIFQAPLATDKFLITTGAQAGFKLHDMTIKGFERAVENAGGSNAHTYSNLLCRDGVYGIVLNGASAVTVEYCCFVNNSTDNGWDNLNAPNSWQNNYWDDLTAIPYLMGGGAGSYDAVPQVRENMPTTTAVSPLEVFDEFDVNIEWAVPACAEPTDLAAFEFKVTWNPADIEIDQDIAKTWYDETFFGSNALYTNPDFSTAGEAVFAAADFTDPGEGAGRLAFLHFKVIGTGTSTITISSDYRDSGGNPLFVLSSPLSLSYQDTDLPEITVFNKNNPIINDTYSDNGPGTVKLFCDIQAQDNYALDRIQYRFDGVGSWTNLVTGIPGTTGGTAGFVYINITGLVVPPTAHTMNVRARDDAGNYSLTEDYPFLRDITGPVIDSFKVADLTGCAASGWTNDSIVAVTYFDDGTGSTMQFYVDGGPWLPASAPYLSYPQGTVSFARTEGLHQVYAQLYDAYGNLGPQWGPVSITMDTTTPGLVGPFSLAGWPPPGPAKTNTASILGNFNAWDANRWKQVASQTFADMTDCSKLGAVAYPVPVSLLGGAGMKKVYFAYADSAGNFAVPIVDSIEYDPIAPTVNSVVITDAAGDGVGGDDCTDGLTFNMTVDFGDGDVVWVNIDDGVTFNSNGDGSAIIASPSTYSFTHFAVPSGTNMGVNVTLTDNAGNTSVIVIDSIKFDNSTPAIGGVVAERTTATVADIFPLASNTRPINLKITGLAADVTELIIAEDGGTPDTLSAPGPITNPYDFAYMWQGSIPTCGWHNVTVRGMDCAGNKSTTVNSNVYFDLDAPIIDSVKGPALTNVLAITINNWVTDCGIWQMRLSEDITFTGVLWNGWAGSTPFTLQNTGDGVRTVYLQVSDYAGNVDLDSVKVAVDQSAPVGAAVLQQNPVVNPLALGGYTNSLNNEVVGISATGGAVDMFLHNEDWTWSTVTWIPVATSVPLVTLSNLGQGPRMIYIYFRDAALNASAAIPLTINYDITAPGAPGTAIGVPGSLTIHWSKVAQAQKYCLRYTFSGDYPLYLNPNPPAPSLIQGFPAGFESDTTWAGLLPQPDKYHFSLWAIDSAGNYSTLYNTQVLTTNYLLGDFSPLPDGCIDFIDEFGDLATGYNTATGNPLFNDSLDIAPTFTGGPTSYPIPDGLMDFEDLIIFAINYDAHGCGFGSPERPATTPEPAAIGPIELFAEVPELVRKGDEFVVALTTKPSGMAEVKGYHLTFDYNHEVVELVGVDAGAMQTSMTKQFFYVDKTKGNIDITGVVFDDQFAEQEVALFTFRATADGKMTISEKNLDLRDRSNAKLEGTFALGTAKVDPLLPKVFALSQNYPNPFNPATTIELALPTASDYTLSVYDITGRTVETFSGFAEAGYLKVEWNARNHASGIYLYKVVAGSFSDTKKMVLLK